PLIDTPAAVRFLSCEPLLGPLDLEAHVAFDRVPGGFAHASPLEMLDWIIVGGESGPGARPCDVQWIRAIVAQCSRWGMPVFVKQLGSVPIESEDAWRERLRVTGMARLLSARNDK